MSLVLLDDLKEKITQDYNNLPSWHKKNVSSLINCRMRAKEIAPHLSCEILNILPRSVRYSQNLKTNINTTTSHINLEYAISCPWVSFDSADFWNALALDIDHQDGLELWESLPDHIKPTLVIDPWSGRSHAIFPLVTPIGMADSMRVGPKILADLCHRLLSDFFKATPLPFGNVIKNPWGLKSDLIGELVRRSPEPETGILWDMMKDSPLCWHTVMGSQKIELRDIIKYFEDDINFVSPSKHSRKVKIKRVKPEYIGRNKHIFDTVRMLCYDGSISDLQEVYLMCQKENTDNLPEREVFDIAKSISKFMRTKYRPKTKIDDRRGVMCLAGSQLSQKDKQKLSALRTHDIQRDNTLHRMKQALKHWPQGQKVSQSKMAKATGLGIATIKRHWSSI